MRIQLHRLPRKIRRLCAIAFDITAVVVAYLLAVLLYSEYPLGQFDWAHTTVLLVSVPTTIAVLAFLGVYRSVIRYVSHFAFAVILFAALVSAASVAMASAVIGLGIEPSVLINFGLLVTAFVAGVRLLFRGLYIHQARKGKQRVIIYGAGSAGRQLALALNNGDQYFPIAFVDDDITMHTSNLMGMRVFKSDEIEGLIKNYSVERVLLALPSTSRSRRAEILSQLENLSVPVQSVPGMQDIIDGKSQIDEIQDVRVEDLLGRDAIAPDSSLMRLNIYQKVVLVTGAGGSIGSELCRQILRYQPQQLILVDSSEFSLYKIERDLSERNTNADKTTTITPLLGSITDNSFIEKLFSSYAVSSVYHAAAYKHVPLVEQNIVAGIKNNAIGTYRLASLAAQANVKNFVLISTDKAVRPTNFMGASKRIAELALQSLAQLPNNTCFSMVRFGNVLGSSGSVVPVFREQIRKGGPLWVTHPEITRYFMTIPEAAQLVIQAGAMSCGGDVYLLDMGEPVKIVDLAKRMVHLSGLEVRDKDNPHGDVEIKFSGLRPGEKLYEELLVDDGALTTEHPRIMKANEGSMAYASYVQLIEKLIKACENFDIGMIKQLLLDAPTQFSPDAELIDWAWRSEKHVSHTEETKIINLRRASGADSDKGSTS